MKAWAYWVFVNMDPKEHREELGRLPPENPPGMRLLLCTPFRTGLTASYMAGLLSTLRGLVGGRPSIKITPYFIENTLVNTARNEAANYALKHGFDAVLFVDDDMGFTLEHILRILDHDVDIVGSLYCKRKGGRPEWLVNLKKGSEIDRDGLCEVNSIGTGFLKIRVSVFREMAERFPEREYVMEGGTEFEFFPIGIRGSRTAEARLARVEKVLEDGFDQGELENLQLKPPLDVLEEVYAAVFDRHPPGTMTGEDVGFCALATQVGFKVHADFGGAIVPHFGKAAFPIAPDMVGMNPQEVLDSVDPEHAPRT